MVIALFVLAALAFSILAGVIESRWARQDRQRLLESTSPVLHPLSRHRLSWMRPSNKRRAARHVAFFLGFLVVTYSGVAVVTAVVRLLAHWLS